MTSCANAILAGALDVSGDLSGRAAELSLRHFTNSLCITPLSWQPKEYSLSSQLQAWSKMAAADHGLLNIARTLHCCERLADRIILDPLEQKRLVTVGVCFCCRRLPPRLPPPLATAACHRRLLPRWPG